MNTVTFPGLGLNFEVSKIAFQIAGIDIYSYAVCIVLGILTALIFCKISEDNYYIKFDCVIETMLFAIIFGIVGARLYYVLFNLKYYFTNPLQIFNLRDGGLALYGGLIAGLIVIIKFSKKYRVHPLDFLDYIVPFLALAQSIGRWGNFFNIEAYGYETTSFLRMRIYHDFGFKDVHPVFLYESIATLIIFAVLRILQPKRKFEGQIFYSYLILYTGVRMFLETLRVDSLMLGNLRISQVLSTIVFFCALFILLKKSIQHHIKESKRIKRKKRIKKVEFCQPKNNANGAILLTLV